MANLKEVWSLTARLQYNYHRRPTATTALLLCRSSRVGTVGYLYSRWYRGHLTEEMESIHFEGTRFREALDLNLKRRNRNYRAFNCSVDT